MRSKGTRNGRTVADEAKSPSPPPPSVRVGTTACSKHAASMSSVVRSRYAATFSASAARQCSASLRTPGFVSPNRRSSNAINALCATAPLAGEAATPRVRPWEGPLGDGVSNADDDRHMLAPEARREVLPGMPCV